MKFVIACGGTGGHFFPGSVLGKTLKSRGHQVLFVLRENDSAGARLDQDSLPYAELDLRGMPRGLSFRWLTFPWKLLKSLRAAFYMLRAYRPDAVVGMGGYITFPVAVAARLTGIPYLLHESNTVPGLANRVCAKHAAAFALGLPFKPAPKNSHLTGTPVRAEIRTASSKPEARRRLKLDERRTTMLVFGGSQGASAINDLVSDIVVKLVSAYPDQLQVIHITGYLDEKSVMSKYTSQSKKLTWLVAPFTEDMADLYAAADFVVCRAGASTISELIALRLPALLIPYPYATDNHQESNAKFLSSAGAGLLRTQKTTTFENLRRDIETLWTEPKRRADMTAAYAKLPIPNTAPSGDALADLAESIARR